MTKISKTKLKQIIKEELETRRKNYMFFQNVNTIKKRIDEISNLSEEQLDALMSEHPWAIDHITTSMDDIEEVYNFIKANIK